MYIKEIILIVTKFKEIMDFIQNNDVYFKEKEMCMHKEFL